MTNEEVKVDKINLTSALHNPVWQMMLLGEPYRLIDVRMTYEDLKDIYDYLRGQELENER